jgi:flagellar protein FlaG
MAQETISSAILIIAAIIATVALVNAVYPSLYTATDSVGSVSSTASDRVKTELKITMSSQPNASALFVWVKNAGSTKILASNIAYTDVYFGDRGNVSRVRSGVSDPYHWSYTLDDVSGDGNWGPGETMQIMITDPDASHLTTGIHVVKLVLYNTASVEDTVTI